jgi:hypothetical protein
VNVLWKTCGLEVRIYANCDHIVSTNDLTGGSPDGAGGNYGARSCVRIPDGCPGLSSSVFEGGS